MEGAAFYLEAFHSALHGGAGVHVIGIIGPDWPEEIGAADMAAAGADMATEGVSGLTRTLFGGNMNYDYEHVCSGPPEPPSRGEGHYCSMDGHTCVPIPVPDGDIEVNAGDARKMGTLRALPPSEQFDAQAMGTGVAPENEGRAKRRVAKRLWDEAAGQLAESLTLSNYIQDIGIPTKAGCGASAPAIGMGTALPIYPYLYHRPAALPDLLTEHGIEGHASSANAIVIIPQLPSLLSHDANQGIAHPPGLADINNAAIHAHGPLYAPGPYRLLPLVLPPSLRIVWVSQDHDLSAAILLLLLRLRARERVLQKADQDMLYHVTATLSYHGYDDRCKGPDVGGAARVSVAQNDALILRGVNPSAILAAFVSHSLGPLPDACRLAQFLYATSCDAPDATDYTNEGKQESPASLDPQGLVDNGGDRGLHVVCTLSSAQLRAAININQSHTATTTSPINDNERQDFTDADISLFSRDLERCLNKLMACYALDACDDCYDSRPQCDWRLLRAYFNKGIFFRIQLAHHSPCSTSDSNIGSIGRAVRYINNNMYEDIIKTILSGLTSAAPAPLAVLRRSYGGASAVCQHYSRDLLGQTAGLAQQGGASHPSGHGPSLAPSLLLSLSERSNLPVSASMLQALLRPPGEPGMGPQGKNSEENTTLSLLLAGIKNSLTALRHRFVLVDAINQLRLGLLNLRSIFQSGAAAELTHGVGDGVCTSGCVMPSDALTLGLSIAARVKKDMLGCGAIDYEGTLARLSMTRATKGSQQDASPAPLSDAFDEAAVLTLLSYQQGIRDEGMVAAAERVTDQLADLRGGLAL